MNKPSRVMPAILLVVNLAIVALMCGLLFGKSPAEDEPMPEQPVSSAAVSSDTTAEPEEPVQPEIQPDSIRLSAYADYLTVGCKMKLDAVVSPSDAGVDSLVWASDNESVLRVSEDGTVEGVSRGYAYVSVTAENGVCDVRKMYVMNPGLVFLSPSRQTGNWYYKKMVSECEQAFKMSGFCKTRLETVGLEVYECPIKYELEDRGKLAAEMNSKCYVAIHTNAGGIETGTMAFYNRHLEGSIRLASSVYETVAPITPDSDSGIKNGIKSDGTQYKETRYPYEVGVPSTLLEVDYHDKEASAVWLFNNPELIGNAIADGIMRFMYENY